MSEFSTPDAVDGYTRSRSCCQECGRPLGYLMSEDRTKPGAIGLYRQWTKSEFSPMAGIAVIGSCILLALIVVGLAQFVGGA